MKQAEVKLPLNQIICGDCIEVMQGFPAGSVDTIITDPPYGLGFMGKEWDTFNRSHKLQSWTTAWANEALRVAKPGAMMLVFGGTRTFHRIACGIEDAGWKLRDNIGYLHEGCPWLLAYCFGSGFPKSMDIALAYERELCEYSDEDDEWYYTGTKEKMRRNPPFKSDNANTWWGWGTALKPAWEPIILAMKPLDGTFTNNALKHGVAGLNIDGGRVEVPDEAQYEFNRRGYHERANPDSEHPYKGGWKPRAVEVQPSKGRFPANLIHDGSEEVLAEFADSAARFFYCAKASRAERNAGLEGMEKYQRDPVRKHGQAGTDNAFNRGADLVLNDHPTVKPLALMQYLVRLTKTPTGGVVLDCFCGSGSTLVACVREERSFIGIDSEGHYCEIARRRVEHEQNQHPLFSGDENA